MHIRVLGLTLYGYHGVYESEAEHGATFEFDVDLRADLSEATAGDAIERTIDYTAVVAVVSEVNRERCNLIETLADRIATALLDRFPAQEVFVRVRKPGAALGAVARCVEVETSKSKAR